MEGKLLSADGLRVMIGKEEPVRASSFSIDYEEAKALIGESGSGKSMTALALIALLPEHAAAEGRIAYRGTEIDASDTKRLSALRGREIAMMSQDPSSSLNPAYRIGKQIRRIAAIGGAEDPRMEAERLLEAAGLGGAGRKYPHQLSGGMCQRALLAMALAASPSLLIADEVTSSLDSDTERAAMELILTMMRERALSLLMISHSIALAASYADSIAVMHGGCTVEEGPAAEVLRHPAHPYTELLAACAAMKRDPDGTLVTIGGRMPGPAEKVPGCTFAGRCPYAERRCLDGMPAWRSDGSHRWRCIHG